MDDEFNGTVYYDRSSGRVYLVPNHYARTLKYINSTVAWARENGIRTPIFLEEIEVQVLTGKQLCIEFNAPMPDYEGTVVVDGPPSLLKTR
jgi:hypothetical protein